MAAGATSLYYNLAKLGRVQLPGGTSYALIDYNGRELIAEVFSANASYEEGQYILYSSDGFGSELFQFTQAHPAGAWNSAHVRGPINVGGELNRLEGLIAGGIHYRGKTSTALYDGATTNPITINSVSYTAEQGDMVIVDRSAVKVDYATGTAYAIHTYILNGGIYYITNAAITSTENTSIDAIRDKLDVVKTDPEFLFDGTIWNVLGSVAEGLGDLAFKDSASGSYTAPTGSGSVSVNDYSTTKKKLSTTTVTTVGGTVGVSKMTAGTAVDIAKAGTAVVYGTADVGDEVTYGTANKASSATTVGNADVGSPVVYGTADVASAVTVAVAGTQVVYGMADVGSEVTYGTANPGTAVTGVAKVGSSKTFATGGITASVTDDCLAFAAAGTSTVIGIADTTGVSITPAVQSTTKLTPATAADTNRKLTPVGSTTSITPAKAADSTRTLTPAVQSSTSIYGAVDSTSKLTPAKAADSTRTIVPAVSNGSITPWSETAHTVAVAASSTTTLATGGLESGDQIVVEVTGTASTKTVTVGTTTSTVVVD